MSSTERQPHGDRLGSVRANQDTMPFDGRSRCHRQYRDTDMMLILALLGVVFFFIVGWLSLQAIGS